MNNCKNNVISKFSRKPFLQLDMKKVAKVDDTFVVVENEYDEDAKSADEFKKLILNTNLIINKTRTSFKSGREERLNLQKMFKF